VIQEVIYFLRHFSKTSRHCVTLFSDPVRFLPYFSLSYCQTLLHLAYSGEISRQRGRVNNEFSPALHSSREQNSMTRPLKLPAVHAPKRGRNKATSKHKEERND